MGDVCVQLEKMNNRIASVVVIALALLLVFFGATIGAAAVGLSALYWLTLFVFTGVLIAVVWWIDTGGTRRGAIDAMLDGDEAGPAPHG